MAAIHIRPDMPNEARNFPWLAGNAEGGSRDDKQPQRHRQGRTGTDQDAGTGYRVVEQLVARRGGTGG